MTTFYIDIESIPDQSEGARQEFIDAVDAPGNYKKPESIEAWKKENAETIGDANWRKTGFDGTRGEIICIAFAVDDNPVICISRKLGEPEDALLSKFMVVARESLKHRRGHDQKNPTWCAHNGTGFDFRFLWQRCVIRKVKPTIYIPYNAKPWEVADTLFMWKGINKTGGSLDTICKAFGMAGKEDIDGSKVWDYVKAGREDEVADYCIQDVEKVRSIYKRMMFLD